VDCNEIGLLKLKVHWGGGGGRIKNIVGRGEGGQAFGVFCFRRLVVGVGG